MLHVTVALGWWRRREGKDKSENEKDLERTDYKAAWSIPLIVPLGLQGVSGMVLEGKQRGVIVKSSGWVV